MPRQSGVTHFMSSRWPQEQQDQRSPYATYDESWSRSDEGPQPWQDSGWHDPESQNAGWQDPGQEGYAEQWASAQGLGQPRGSAVARAVAEPLAPGRQDHPSQPVAPQPRDPAAGAYQQEWDQSGGGFGDDADYEWFQYLSGGRPAQAKPAAVPVQRPSAPERGRPDPRPERGEKTRRGARSERSRSRRAPARPAPADPGNGRPEFADPRFDRPERTDPGYGRADFPDPRLARSEFADPTYG